MANKKNQILITFCKIFYPFFGQNNGRFSMNSPELNTEMMRVVGKSDWFGGGVRITKVVAQTGVVRPDERITI